MIQGTDPLGSIHITIFLMCMHVWYVLVSVCVHMYVKMRV